MRPPQSAVVRLWIQDELPEGVETFVRGMINRMIVSYHKYGPLKLAYPHKVNAVESLRQRVDEYRKTGNTEWLIDAANFAMIHFIASKMRVPPDEVRLNATGRQLEIKVVPVEAKTEVSQAFLQFLLDDFSVWLTLLPDGTLSSAYNGLIPARSLLDEAIDRYGEDQDFFALNNLAFAALVEYLIPTHPQAHYRGTDADESPGRKTVHGRTTKRENLDVPRPL